MSTKDIRKALGAVCGTLSLKGRVWTARRGFFYPHGRTAEMLFQDIKAAIPGAVLVESREIWKPFRGGESTANNSHWLVRFTVS